MCLNDELVLKCSQLVNIDKYKQYYIGKQGISEAKMQEFIKMRLENQRQYVKEKIRQRKPSDFGNNDSGKRDILR